MTTAGVDRIKLRAAVVTVGALVLHVCTGDLWLLVAWLAIHFPWASYHGLGLLLLGWIGVGVEAAAGFLALYSIPMLRHLRRRAGVAAPVYRLLRFAFWVNAALWILAPLGAVIQAITVSSPHR